MCDNFRPILVCLLSISLQYVSKKNFSLVLLVIAQVSLSLFKVGLICCSTSLSHMKQKSNRKDFFFPQPFTHGLFLLNHNTEPVNILGLQQTALVKRWYLFKILYILRKLHELLIGNVLTLKLELKMKVGLSKWAGFRKGSIFANWFFAYLIQAPSSPSACHHSSFTFSSPNYCVPLNKTTFPALLTLSSRPTLMLSVGCRWGLWNADSGTRGSLHGPAQCISPAPQDAVIHLTSSISHFVSSLHLCLSALASVDTLAIATPAHLITFHRLRSSQCFYIHH